MQHLFIDLDDTLVDSSGSYDRAMLSVGIDPQDKDYLSARRRVKLMLDSSHPSSHNRNIYFKFMLEERGEYSPSRHLELMSGYETFLSNDMASQWKELGRSALLIHLKEKFLTINLLTNETLRMQSLKLINFDPHFDLFDSLLTSEEAGADKPNHKIFDLALARLGVEPKQVVMVGDSYPNDIKPCLEKGIQAIYTSEFLKQDSIQQNLPKNVTEISNLNQLLDFF